MPDPPLPTRVAYWTAQILAQSPRIDGTVDEEETRTIVGTLLGGLLAGQFPDWSIITITLAPYLAPGDFVKVTRGGRLEYGRIVQGESTLMVEFGDEVPVAIPSNVVRI